MVTIIITTYYPANLRISLTRLKWLNFDFHLLIHNDNPSIKLTREDIKNYGYEGGVVILNEDRNLGCWDSRMQSVKYVLEYLRDTTHFIFCDDDDVLLYPQFSDNLVTNHNALVTKRLKEQLMLMVPNPDIEEVLKSGFVEDERPKMGCVGVSYRVELWRELVPILEEFKPTLSRLYGSDRILEPDDVFYMLLIREYLEWTRPEVDVHTFYTDTDSYSYSLTLLEDRKGRYWVDPNCIDLRYGEVWDGRTYQQRYDELCYAFRDFVMDKEKPQRLF